MSRSASAWLGLDGPLVLWTSNASLTSFWVLPSPLASPSSSPPPPQWRSQRVRALPRRCWARSPHYWRRWAENLINENIFILARITWSRDLHWCWERVSVYVSLASASRQRRGRRMCPPSRSLIWTPPPPCPPRCRHCCHTHWSCWMWCCRPLAEEAVCIAMRRHHGSSPGSRPTLREILGHSFHDSWRHALRHLRPGSGRFGKLSLKSGFGSRWSWKGLWDPPFLVAYVLGMMFPLRKGVLTCPTAI